MSLCETKYCLKIAVVAAFLCSFTAHAQVTQYPSRVVTIVAPSAPGGLYSVFARLIASKLQEKLQATIIVENKPGAASIVGATYVARSTPDGHTLLVASTATIAVNQWLHKNLSYDPRKDFVPIAFIARAPEVLVVNSDLSIHSVADLVNMAKKMPGKLTCASAGIGTAQHLEAELLQRKLALSMLHVPYRGATAALTDVAAGHVSLMFTPVANAIGMIQTGRVRPIGLATSDIIPALPNVKPLSELGVPDFYADSWFMLVAPAKTPEHIIETLRQQMATIARDPEFIANLTQQGLLPVKDLTIGELNSLIDKEAQQWRDVITQGGISAE